MANRSRRAVKLPVGSTTEPEYELTDEQWHLIADRFPETPVGPKGGRPGVASRPCVEDILWTFRSGARWKDLPKHFPSTTTCWRRHKQWSLGKGVGAISSFARSLGSCEARGSDCRRHVFLCNKRVKRLARPSEVKEPRSWFLPMRLGSRLESTQPALVLTK